MEAPMIPPPMMATSAVRRIARDGTKDMTRALSGGRNGTQKGENGSTTHLETSVREEGVEPSRPYGHTPLKRTRLPLRHSRLTHQFYRGASVSAPWLGSGQSSSRGGAHGPILDVPEAFPRV